MRLGKRADHKGAKVAKAGRILAYASGYYNHWMTPNDRQQLVRAALAARGSAYAVYSGFQVGAAVLCADGQVFPGCNVENASYGLTVCAERVAACAAVASGQRSFTAVAIVTPGRGVPCGACRQFLAEFCADDAVLLLIDGESEQVYSETTLGALFPSPFRLRGG